jgi:hypothetical protein
MRKSLGMLLTSPSGVLADLVAKVEKRASEVPPSLTLPLSGGGSASQPGSAA